MTQGWRERSPGSKKYAARLTDIICSSLSIEYTPSKNVWNNREINPRFLCCFTNFCLACIQLTETNRLCPSISLHIFYSVGLCHPYVLSCKARCSLFVEPSIRWTCSWIFQRIDFLFTKLGSDVSTVPRARRNIECTLKKYSPKLPDLIRSSPSELNTRSEKIGEIAYKSSISLVFHQFPLGVYSIDGDAGIMSGNHAEDF